MLVSRKIQYVVFLLIAALLFTAAPLRAATVFQLSEVHPSDYPTTLGDIKFAGRVNQRSNGRIKIDIYHSGQLFDEKSAIESMQMGALAFNRANPQLLSDFNKAFGVITLPYLFRDEEHLWKVLNGPVGEELLKELEANGIVGLCYYDSGSRCFYNSKRVIKSPADMKGLKIRVQQSKIMMDMVESLGASATPMAYGEIYTGLQSGVIDGAENNWPSYFSTSHWEVARHYTLDHHTRTPDVLCMSKVVWDRLSPEDQRIIKAAALESQTPQRKAWKEYEDKAVRQIMASGKNTVDEINDVAEWQTAVQKIYKTIDCGSKRDEYIKKIQDVK